MMSIYVCNELKGRTPSLTEFSPFATTKALPVLGKETHPEMDRGWELEDSKMGRSLDRSFVGPDVRESLLEINPFACTLLDRM